MWHWRAGGIGTVIRSDQTPEQFRVAIKGKEVHIKADRGGLFETHSGSRRVGVWTREVIGSPVPAAITIAAPAYALCPFGEPFEEEDIWTTPRFPPLPAPPGFGSIGPPMAEWVRCGTPCLLGSLGVLEGVGSRPSSYESFILPGNWQGFLSWNALLFQIRKYVVPVGKCKLQTICVSLLWGIHPR